MDPSLYHNSTATPATQAANTGVFLVGMVITLAIILVAVVSVWKIYTKAGKPGWAAIIPIYNVYVQLQIIGRPWWWLLLLLVPFVNIIVSIVIAVDLAKVFGKSVMFAILGLIIFPYVGYPMLAFGSAKYVGPQGAAPAGPTPPPSAGPTPPAPPAPPAPPSTPPSA